MNRVIRSFIAVSVLFIIGCDGYVPGEKLYWDIKVDELCKKEGGTKIFSRYVIVRKGFPSAKITNYGRLVIPDEGLASSADPYYIVTNPPIYIVKNRLIVVKNERSVIRSANKEVVSKQVSFSRIGGDYDANNKTSHSCNNIEEESKRFLDSVEVEA
jgi:hypothetical protein